MPRVTVIIPTYNRSEVLTYSIGSVLRQTFSDWELLVIGDGCTDDSPAIVAQMAEKDELKRIRWINLPQNTGNQSGPNNRGLEEARGELIAYLGHDDLWLPLHLETLVAAMDAGADVAHSVIRWVTLPDERPDPHFFAVQKLVSPCAVMHRLSVTQQLNGWRDYREIETFPDADLWHRIREAKFRIVLVPRLTVIKIPAMRRTDVYKTRPFDEQAAWFQRIGSEADLETSQFTAIIAEASEALHREPSGFAADARRLWLDFIGLIRRALHRLRHRKTTNLVEKSRLIRGLDAKP